MSASTERKARAQVYRDAARGVERGRFSGTCTAIHLCTSNRFPPGQKWRDLSPESLEFQKRFCPLTSKWYFGQWLIEAASRNLLHEQDMEPWRILALCFMAAMVEAGDA